MDRYILIFLILLTNAALSQTNVQRNFTQGYIVLLSGDTLKGNVALFSEEESSAHVDFKKNNYDTVSVFKPAEVSMYKRDNSFYFTKPVTDKKNAFVKIMEKGKVNLYKYSYETARAGSGEEFERKGPVEIKQNNKPPEKSFDYYLEKTKGDFKKIYRINMRGDLWNFFKGDDEQVKKIKSSKLEYDELPALIKDYNNSH